MLEIKDLTHWYGVREPGHGPPGQLALDGVSLRVADGELVSIVGPSGCGKSTLLRCVAGLITPASGAVVLDGAPVDRVPDGLAVVFQDYSRSLLPWLSVQDNVGLPLRKKTGGRAGRTARAERREVAARALETVGLAGAGTRYPWQLSGGMQQRVAIARALACDPALLLMDEPFGSVDAQTREDLEDLILAVRRQRDITILLVTHDIDESVYVGDRVVVLTRGPGRVRADLPVDLPAPRDQISTRELPAFVHLRASVGRLVRGQEAPAAGKATGPTIGPAAGPATEPPGAGS
jgi:NitT/TauT family transport system ATP-binding protein